jgi:hypothetical protein
MILQEISDYVKKAGRIEEKTLLKHFHLSRDGLAPMMSVLLKRGKIQKTIIQRGKSLPPDIFYSWTNTAQIPTLTVI